jgi:hypothetical protein
MYNLESFRVQSIDHEAELNEQIRHSEAAIREQTAYLPDLEHLIERLRLERDEIYEKLCY